MRKTQKVCHNLARKPDVERSRKQCKQASTPAKLSSQTVVLIVDSPDWRAGHRPLPLVLSIYSLEATSLADSWSKSTLRTRGTFHSNFATTATDKPSVLTSSKIIVRDLWALRLQSLKTRASSDPDADVEHASQLFSSQSEGETTDDAAPRRKRRRKEDCLPRLPDAISLIYMGTNLLRLPVTVKDLHTWLTNGGLIYYRAIRSLPISMKQKLPGMYHIAIDPQHILKPEALHSAVLDNMVMYHRSFGMEVPLLNHQLVLYRFVHTLSLPLEVYAATIRLSEMLQIAFHYDFHTQVGRSYQVFRLAEGKLMALLVVATKLLFPFDGIKRYPRNASELAALLMDWEAWGTTHSDKTDKTDELDYKRALATTENDVLKMSAERLDQYMDWYETSFVDEQIRETGRVGREAEFRRAMFRFFPISRLDGSQSEAPLPEPSPGNVLDGRIRDVQGALAPLRVISDEVAAADRDHDPRRPGSMYKRYREAGDLEGHAKRFYMEAAEVVGLSLETLVQGVFWTERKMQTWEESARRDQ